MFPLGSSLKESHTHLIPNPILHSGNLVLMNVIHGPDCLSHFLLVIHVQRLQNRCDDSFVMPVSGINREKHMAGV